MRKALLAVFIPLISACGSPLSAKAGGQYRLAELGIAKALWDATTTEKRTYNLTLKTQTWTGHHRTTTSVDVPTNSVTNCVSVTKHWSQTAESTYICPNYAGETVEKLHDRIEKAITGGFGTKVTYSEIGVPVSVYIELPPSEMPDVPSAWTAKVSIEF